MVNSTDALLPSSTDHNNNDDESVATTYDTSQSSGFQDSLLSLLDISDFKT